MNAFTGNIFSIAKENDHYRKEVATADDSQIVVMSIPPGDDVGEEAHDDTEQTLLFVSGSGKSVLNGEESPLEEGTVVVVPKGTRHNFINTGDSDLKIVTMYVPPHHPPGTVHATKADAQAEEESE